MKSRADILVQPAIFQSRAIGAFIGLAIGDAVGDLGRDQEYRNRYGLISRLLKMVKAPMIPNSACSLRVRCSMLTVRSRRRKLRRRGVVTFSREVVQRKEQGGRSTVQ